MATKNTDTKFERDMKRMSEILENTAGMERSEIEALVGLLKLRKDTNKLDKAVLERILKDRKLSDESMDITRKVIYKHLISTKKGGAKRKRRRKTKRKTKRKKRSKTKRNKRRKRRKRRTRKMRGGG